MATQKKKPKSFLDSARDTIQRVSDTLNPAKQFGGSARDTMERARDTFGGSRDRAIDRGVDKALKGQDAGSGTSLGSKNKRNVQASAGARSGVGRLQKARRYT